MGIHSRRRKLLIHSFEAAALSLVLLDCVLYFVVVRPLSAMVESEQQNYSIARANVRLAEQRVERLQKSKDSLPDAQAQIGSFLQKHIPSRQRAFSRAAMLVRDLSQKAGLPYSVSYRLETPHNEPLQTLGIDVSVTGPFPALLGFAHSLETAKDFVVLRSFDFEPNQTGALTLRVRADLYYLP